MRKAVKELSAKPAAVKKDEGLKTLIDEALDIKKQLEALTHRFDVQP